MTAYKDATYFWNGENRLIKAVLSDNEVEFLYDYMGRRVRKRVYVGTGDKRSLTTEKQFVYDGWNLVKEITVEGGSESAKYYVWGLDLSQSLQGAGGVGGLICSVDAGEVRHYFCDGNGNVGQVVKESGVITARYEYDPFGKTVIIDGSEVEGNVFRFSSKYFDGETGFSYYGFRYYSSGLGLWLSRDSIGERGGVNLYGFLENRHWFS